MNNESIVTFSLTLFGSVHISKNDFVMHFNTELFHKYLYKENTSTSELTVAFFKFPIRMICGKYFLQLQDLENIVDPVQVSNTISEILDSVGNSTETGDHDKDPIKSGDLEKTTDILSHIIRIGNLKNATVNSEVLVFSLYKYL
jgi:lipid-A-disaccharide synthase-like uncharacterized protein